MNDTKLVMQDLSDEDLIYRLWQWHCGMRQGFNALTFKSDEYKKYPKPEGHVVGKLIDSAGNNVSYHCLLNYMENSRHIYLIENEIIKRPPRDYRVVKPHEMPKIEWDIGEPIVSVLDIESEDTKTTGEILDVAIVTGNLATGEILKVFEVGVNSKNCNRTRSKGTIKFWQKMKVENPVAYHISHNGNGKLSLKETLTLITEWQRSIEQELGNVPLFGNGPEYDQGTLEDAFNQFRMPVPWKFYYNQSCRTMSLMERWLLGTDCKYAEEYEVTHIALEDATREFYTLASQYQAFKAAIEGCGCSKTQE
tara:strand:- start:210872 stop:211795 length:924 start_codon:yes stop_codon:yes gene_type:complete